MSLELAIKLKDQGRIAESEVEFRKLADNSPNHAGNHNNLGIILYMQGKFKESEECYRRSLKIDSNSISALRNLGNVLIADGRHEDSIEPFRHYAELVYGGNESPYYKVNHDKEQFDYLGIEPKFHLEEGFRVGQAINPDSTNGNIEAKWQSDPLKIAVIDNVFSEEALSAIRRYCWGSTVWQKPYPNGYLGAFPEHGFACPLLLQIADELRSAFPVIIGDYPLIYWWGFKYDSRLRGIHIHADIAVVNVNLWITPDEANLDKEHGGLVVWDKPAPSDWDFKQYNHSNSTHLVREFLKKSEAKPITVPYKANRAVIFDADLLHETDKITFKEGYLNRRINITMLYGDRKSKKV